MKNPILDPAFSHNLKSYLNSLDPNVKKNSKKTTHAIKSFLMEKGLNEETIGWANQIRARIKNFKNREFLFDAAGCVHNANFPSECIDLTFIAESENDPRIEKILFDANKLPIVRTDVRLMFFKANDRDELEHHYDRLYQLFKNHRRSELGDIYIISGQNKNTGQYYVRKLTIKQEKANSAEWEEF